LRRNDTNLCHMPAQAIEQLSALRNEHLANLVLHEHGLIVDAPYAFPLQLYVIPAQAGNEVTSGQPNSHARMHHHRC
jgi:hypothetical protein